jgi:hypothetical protein
MLHGVICNKLQFATSLALHRLKLATCSTAPGFLIAAPGTLGQQLKMCATPIQRAWRVITAAFKTYLAAN